MGTWKRKKEGAWKGVGEGGYLLRNLINKIKRYKNIKLRFIHSFIHLLIQPFSIPSFHSRPLARSLANPLLLILISVSQLRKGLVNFLRSLHSTVAALHCTALLFFASFPLFLLLLLLCSASCCFLFSRSCSVFVLQCKREKRKRRLGGEEERGGGGGGGGGGTRPGRKKKTKRNRSESFFCFFCCVVGGGHPCLGCQAPTTA